MKTLLSTLLAYVAMCTLCAQDINLDYFKIDVENEVSVNTKHSEFGMVKSINGQWMFTSDRDKFSNKNVFLADNSFKMYSCDPMSAYRSVKPMNVALKANSNNGPASPVQNNEFYFTSTNKKATLNWMAGTKTNMLTISKASMVDGQWKVEVIKEFKSTEYNYGQPTVSKDGKTLFFSSNMEGGFGKSDLYVSNQTEKGWTEPVNLGAAINTDGNDMFPFIHESGVLFFASNGHRGFGGLDLYMTRQTEEGWTTPENMGSPVNTASDDFSVYINNNFTMGYFSSDRDGGLGGDDIYKMSFTSMGHVPEQLASAEDEKVEEQTPMLAVDTDEMIAEPTEAVAAQK